MKISRLGDMVRVYLDVGISDGFSDFLLEKNIDLNDYLPNLVNRDSSIPHPWLKLLKLVSNLDSNPKERKEASALARKIIRIQRHRGSLDEYRALMKLWKAYKGVTNEAVSI